jgi:SAM-dependent methyltransferase
VLLPPTGCGQTAGDDVGCEVVGQGMGNAAKSKVARGMGRKRSAGKSRSAGEMRVVERGGASVKPAASAPVAAAPVIDTSVSSSPPAPAQSACDPNYSPFREAVRDLKYSAKSYVGRTKMKSAAMAQQGENLPIIPQAVVVDESLEMLMERDWREYYSRRLTGKGLEIGPLHRPMVRHEGMVVDYIDRCTVKELREHYPELNDLPLVEPNIIGDAETLANIKDKTYDFVIAAHVIEHMRNPLFALEQWCRVLKPKGRVYLIVPDKRITFDRNRVRTNIEHIIQDYRSPSLERDFDHFIDYAVHVHKKSGSEAIAEAERLVKTDYSIHFHVFLPADILNLIDWFSANIRPVKVVKGPSMSPGSDEFHLLLQVN